MRSKHRGDGVIFCRYRRTRIGRALDARRCGFKVWLQGVADAGQLFQG